MGITCIYASLTTRVGVPLHTTRVGVPLHTTRVCAQAIHHPGMCTGYTPPGYVTPEESEGGIPGYTPPGYTGRYTYPGTPTTLPHPGYTTIPLAATSGYTGARCCTRRGVKEPWAQGGEKPWVRASPSVINLRNVRNVRVSARRTLGLPLT